MSIDVLKENIRSNKIRNLYLFYGPEEYLKKYYQDSMEKSLLNEDLKSLNKIVLEGKVEARQIIDTCETLPVFSDKKLVVVKNSVFFKPKKKSEDESVKSKSHGEDLLSYLQNVAGHTCLIFIESEIDKRLKIVDAVKKNGLVVEFPFQKPAELIKWVIKVFNSHKKDIDQAVASQLVDNSEQGMNEILNEIKKVTLYLGDRSRVTGRDIENICTKSIKSRIFDLTDAIAEKNGEKALKMLNDMVILKEPVPKILFMIARQFRQVLEMKLLSASGVPMGDAAAKMGLSPYAAGKIVRQAGSFTVDKLKEAIEESLELDIAVKTGRLNDRMAAELLISRFSQG